jgi:hypothetical protein
MTTSDLSFLGKFQFPCSVRPEMFTSQFSVDSPMAHTFSRDWRYTMVVRCTGGWPVLYRCWLKLPWYAGGSNRTSVYFQPIGTSGLKIDYRKWKAATMTTLTQMDWTWAWKQFYSTRRSPLVLMRKVDFIILWLVQTSLSNKFLLLSFCLQRPHSIRVSSFPFSINNQSIEPLIWFVTHRSVFFLHRRV